MTCGIYLINHKPSGRKYVGKSVNIEERWKAHKKTRAAKDTYLARALAKYGPEAFDFQILEICTPGVLNEREKYHIQELNTLWPEGFNLTAGGDGGKPAPPVLAKISRSQTLRFTDPAERKKASEAMRQIMSLPENRERAAKVGHRVMNKEHKERLRLINANPERHAPHARVMRALYSSPEHKLRISLQNRDPRQYRFLSLEAEFIGTRWEFYQETGAHPDSVGRLVRGKQKTVIDKNGVVWTHSGEI